MIELLEGLPDGVVGFEAVGEFESADYKTIAAPEVERALGAAHEDSPHPRAR